MYFVSTIIIFLLTIKIASNNDISKGKQKVRFLPSFFASIAYREQKKAAKTITTTTNSIRSVQRKTIASSK